MLNKLLSLSAVCAALTAFPAVASTEISGYEIVTQETSVDSFPVKQVIIECPAGKYALGAGWSALDKTGAFLDGRVMASEPSWDGSGWLFNVEITDGYRDGWKLRARIICAKVS